MLDIHLLSHEEVIHNNHLMAQTQEFVHYITFNETSPSSGYDLFLLTIQNLFDFDHVWDGGSGYLCGEQLLVLNDARFEPFRD